MRITLLTLLSVLTVSLSAKDVYVDSSNATTGDGSRKNPYRDLATAHAKVQQLAQKSDVTLIFEDGIYYLQQALEFTPQGKNKITYKAKNQGQAIVSGGQSLDLTWKPYKDGIFCADLPKVENIDQIFINNQRQRMARYPNATEGKNVFDCWDLVHKNVDTTDVSSAKIAAKWQHPETGYMHGMHRSLWGGMSYQITGKKPNGELAMIGGWQNNRPATVHNTYRYVEHIFEELDAPGEWFFDKAEMKLYFYPTADIDLSTASVEIVQLKNIFNIQGTRENTIQNICIDGLKFKHAARTFMENKEPLLRSDWTVYRGGAITFNNAENCTIVNCDFDQLGGNAIMVNNYNRNILVKSCFINEAGANGVAFVGDPDAVREPLFAYRETHDYSKIDLTPGPKTDNYPAECTVTDCIITRSGRFEKQTAGVQISMSYGITVSHCSIYDVPRAGINISEGTFGGHLVEYCDVFNTVLETGDHGSFNSWGRDRHWVANTQHTVDAVAKNPELRTLDMLAPNVIRNSRWRCDHGWDIDLDDGSSNYIIYNNVLLNGGLKLREGYNRTAYNNIIINSGLYAHVWYKNSQDSIYNNIFYSALRPGIMQTTIAEDGKWGDLIDKNVFATNQTDKEKYAKNDADHNSIVFTPKYVDEKNGDYTLTKENAEIFDLGFENIEMNFGVTSPRLKAIAKTPDFPTIKK